MRSMLTFERWGLEPQKDKINLRVVGDESLLGHAMPNGIIDGSYFNYTFASVLERQGFRVLADLAKLNIPIRTHRSWRNGDISTRSRDNRAVTESCGRCRDLRAGQKQGIGA
jgi:hypothetical protein